MGMHELLQKDPEIWDLFCRKEEYDPSIRDKYHRFPYYASACRSVFEPRASEYLMKHGFTVPYPEGKSFAVCLTHDVDLVYASTLDKGVVRMKQAAHGRFRESVASIRQVFSKKHPNTNFEDIMNLEERYNARSSFYFLHWILLTRIIFIRLRICTRNWGPSRTGALRSGFMAGIGDFGISRNSDRKKPSWKK